MEPSGEGRAASDTIPELLNQLEGHSAALARCLASGDAPGARTAAEALARRSTPLHLKLSRRADHAVPPAAPSEPSASSCATPSGGHAAASIPTVLGPPSGGYAAASIPTVLRPSAPAAVPPAAPSEPSASSRATPSSGYAAASIPTVLGPPSGGNAAASIPTVLGPPAPASVPLEQPQRATTQRVHLDGSNVEYYSQTHGGWVAAVVQGFDETSSTYKLDIHPQALPSKVRAVSAAAPEAKTTTGACAKQPTVERVVEERYPDGSAVEYFSTTHNGWVSAIVKGFTEQTGTYVLDIQPIALVSKVRRAPGAAQLPQGCLSAVAQAAPRGAVEVQGARPTDMSQCRPQRACGLCQASFFLDDLVGPECEHLFCKVCLNRHVLRFDFLRQRVPCPGNACGVEMTPLQVRHVVGDEVFADRQAQMAKEDEMIARKLLQEQQRQEEAQQGLLRRQPMSRQKTSLQRQATLELPGAGTADKAHPLLGGALRPAEHVDGVVNASQPQISEGSAAEAREFDWIRAELMRGAAKLRTPCGLCRVERDDLLGPICGHLFCTPCLGAHVSRQDFVQTPVFCPIPDCGIEIATEQVRHLVGEAVYARRQAEVDERAAKALQDEFAREADEIARRGTALEFKCPLCLENGSRDDAIELDCDHKLCHECFRNYLSSKITEAQVGEDELVCPIPACRRTITVAQVEGATSGTQLWDKFLQFRMNQWRPGSASAENIVECPARGCEGRFLVSAQVKFVKCPMCSYEFCPKCGLEKHEGSTCEAFQAWKNQNSNADRHFEELMAQQQWRRCPVCTAPSERESGCNFMQCRSERCRKYTYWCYICGKQLPKEEHYSHYPRGPYEDECHTPVAERLPVIGGPTAAPPLGVMDRVTDAVGGLGLMVGGMIGVRDKPAAAPVAHPRQAQPPRA